jgi:hypothetical protein
VVEHGEGSLLGARCRSAPATGQRIWRGVAHRVYTLRPERPTTTDVPMCARFGLISGL